MITLIDSIVYLPELGGRDTISFNSEANKAVKGFINGFAGKLRLIETEEDTFVTITGSVVFLGNLVSVRELKTIYPSGLSDEAKERIQYNGDIDLLKGGFIIR